MKIVHSRSTSSIHPQAHTDFNGGVCSSEARNDFFRFCRSARKASGVECTQGLNVEEGAAGRREALEERMYRVRRTTNLVNRYSFSAVFDVHLESCLEQHHLCGR